MTKTRPSDVPLPPADEENLTRLEGCRVVRIGLTTFDQLVATGRLRVHRIGRRIVVKRVAEPHHGR
jgi:hypothetical protein